MSFPRASGILLHPTSLPSRGGIGDFGPAAYRFADFLASASQGFWQVLPLGPLGYGNSPYSSTSAFAGNPLLISLERLAQHGWIDSAKLASLAAESGPVEYDQVFASKMPLLFEAAKNFTASAAGRRPRALQSVPCRELLVARRFCSLRRAPGAVRTGKLESLAARAGASRTCSSRKSPQGICRRARNS